MVDHGIKPCYIFDGKPPELKGSVVRTSYTEHAVTTDREYSLLNVSLAEKKRKKEKKKQRRLVQRRMLTSLPEDKCE